MSPHALGAVGIVFAAFVIVAWMYRSKEEVRFRMFGFLSFDATGKKKPEKPETKPNTKKPNQKNAKKPEKPD